MGKNAGKPVRHTGGSGGGESYEDAWQKREFHSKAYQQQELQLLINAPERLTWDEWKAAQQKKKEEEEAEFYGHGMDMMTYRAQLDVEREGRLKARVEAQELERNGQKKSKKKSSKKKTKRKSSKDKDKDKKRRKDGSSESSSSESDEHRGKKKAKKASKDASAYKLSAFFNANSEDEDAL
jgi:hypothetical protein